MRKRTARKLTSIGLAMSLVLPLNLINIQAYETPIDNPIENILSDYELFVENDIIFRNHLMGAFFAGGILDADWSSMGDAAMTDCYANRLLSNVNFNTGTHTLPNGMKGITDAKLYYGSTSLENLNDKFIQVDDYANTDKIFSSIRIESMQIANNSNTTPIDEDNIHKIYCTSDENVYVTIEDDLLDDSYYIYANDIDWFANHICAISVIGVNDSYISTSIYNGKYKIFADNQEQSLSAMAGALEGGQINYDGMNLIWNFPDASRTIDTSGGWLGHLVAPNADIKYSGNGQFNGGIIAKSFVSAGCEGHFYPMSLKFNFDKEEETTTEIISSEEETTTELEVTEEETTTIEITTELETTTIKETTTETETTTIEETTTEIEDTTVEEITTEIEDITVEATTQEETSSIKETTTEIESTTEIETTVVEETTTEIETTIIEETTTEVEITTAEEPTTTVEASTVEETTTIGEEPTEITTVQEETTMAPIIRETTIQENNDVIIRETTTEKENAVINRETTSFIRPSGSVLGDAGETGSLPITGKLQWPITVFGLSGIVLMFMGIFCKKKEN